MKNILFAFILLSYTSSKADTIASWTVYLGKTKLKTFTEVETDRNLKLEASRIKPGDYLVIQYGDDTPCHDCEYEILIRDQYKGPFTSKKFKNQSDKVKLSLDEVMKDYKVGENPKLFLVFFNEFHKGKLINYGVRLFTFTIN